MVRPTLDEQLEAAADEIINLEEEKNTYVISFKLDTVAWSYQSWTRTIEATTLKDAIRCLEENIWRRYEITFIFSE